MPAVERLSETAASPERVKARLGALRHVSLATWVAVGALGAGVVLRLVRFLADRSLWLDESLLSINLLTRSYGELVETLDYNQGAPIGFLWTERLALDLFGDSELSLRLFPLLVGLASLALFYLVAVSVLERLGSLVAIGLFAAMEPFIRYSAEVKQYGLDVAVGLALVYLFVRALETAQPSLRRTVLVAVAGPVAVAFSHPSVFVLAGVAVAGIYASLQRRDSKALVHQLVAYGVWLVSFLVVYFVALRDLDDLRSSVRRVGSGAGERFKNVYTIFNEPGGFPRTAVGLAAAVALVGVVYLLMRRPALVVLLAVTTSSLLAAGYLGLYPVGQRFLLFLLPLAVVCFAEGVSGIARQAPRLLAGGLLAGVAAIILLPVAGTAAQRLVAPPKIEEIEPLLAEVASNWQAGDVLYLYSSSQYAFRYYVECDDCGAISNVAQKLWPSRPTGGGQAQTTPAIVSRSPTLIVGASTELEHERLENRSRAWLLYSHFFPRTEADLLAEADRAGRRIGCTHGGASLLCLYDFSARSPTG